MDIMTQITFGKSFLRKLSQRQGVGGSFATRMSFSFFMLSPKVFFLPMMLRLLRCLLIKKSLHGHKMTIPDTTTPSSKWDLLTEKAAMHGKRSRGNSGLSMSLPKSHCGPIISSWMIGLSSSRKSMGTRTRWKRRRFGTLMKLSPKVLFFVTSWS